MTKDVEYGNQRYQQGYEAGYQIGFAEGTVAEVQEDTWDEGFNEGFEAGEVEGYDFGYHAGIDAEQKRIQTVIRMHMEWAKRDGKGRDFIFWNNVAETLQPKGYTPLTEEEWKQELENLGF